MEDAWLPPTKTETVTGPRVRMATARRRLVIVAGRINHTCSARRVVIGRNPGCDLVLDHPSISGRHVELVFGDTATAQDLGSRNGTWLCAPRREDDRRIHHVEIYPGDRLRIGSQILRIAAIGDLDIEVTEDDEVEGMYGTSLAMRELFAAMLRLGPVPLDVLIQGETGTGKELVARALHKLSPRRNKPFVVVDCRVLGHDTARVQLFGAIQGSYTGARNSEGLVQSADGGTIFFDEISELPLDLQPILLRFLDRREYQRLGETTYHQVDVRVVAATQADLKMMTAARSFREDLYFRLVQDAIFLPPLRDRDEDIEGLARRLLRQFRPDQDLQLDKSALSLLRDHAWPGNVRELQSTLLRASTFARGNVITGDDLRIQVSERVQLDRALRLAMDQGCHRDAHRLVDAAMVPVAVAQANGNLSEAARSLGLSVHRLQNILKDLARR